MLRFVPLRTPKHLLTFRAHAEKYKTVIMLQNGAKHATLPVKRTSRSITVVIRVNKPLLFHLLRRHHRININTTPARLLQQPDNGGWTNRWPRWWLDRVFYHVVNRSLSCCQSTAILSAHSLHGLVFFPGEHTPKDNVARRAYPEKRDPIAI